MTAEHSSNSIARTPQPPYYAVVFTSLRTELDEAGYAKTVARMAELAAQQPGYLGMESAGGDHGPGITVSYWQDLESLRAWRLQAEHQLAQQQGQAKWYAAYSLRVCRVEAAVEFVRPAETQT